MPLNNNDKDFEEKTKNLQSQVEKSKPGILEITEKVEKGAEVVNKLAGGIKEMVTGISSGNWQATILAGLSIVGTVAALAGPVGAAVAAILSIISTIFGLFSGTQAVVTQESKDIQLSKIIDEALDKARVEGLRAEAEGLKRTISSIQNSVSEFREKKNFNKHTAVQLFDKVFVGLNFFGELKYMIKVYCVGIVDDFSLTEQVENATINANKCLEISNLYAELSILKQLLITDIASLSAEAGLNGSYLNLIFFTNKEQMIDRDVLRFFLDPINFKISRFCVSHFYGAPSRYPALHSYLMALSKLSEGRKLLKHAMFCSDKQLQGDCYQLPLFDNKIMSKRAHSLGAWANKISSLFISNGAMLYLIKHKEATVPYGPFYGPTVHGKLRSNYTDYILDENNNDKPRVRFCRDDYLAQTEYCVDVETGEYADLKSGPFKDGWENQVQSFDIPANMKVTIWNKENFEGNEIYGPFYGPNVIGKARDCGNFLGYSIQISYAEKSSFEMVKICTEAYMTGMCDFFEDGKLDLQKFRGCRKPYFKQIKSMDVPGGKVVEMWKGANFTGQPVGPYIGPITIPLVESGNAHDFTISIKTI